MDSAQRVLDLYPKIFFACHTRHVRDTNSGAELTAKQASILDHLDLHVGVSLSGLAAHMAVTPATMCVAVDKLVSLGLVDRRRSATDRRQVLLHLTANGKEVSDAHSVLDRERVAGMLAELGVEDREAGLRGLAILAEAAGRYLQKTGPGWKDQYSEKE
ncbi:MAG: winged helix-turn-helix transcriptional regulator [Armatimonadetes bacterium]|nr:winged helix-turn-helix transcriptional regulator [Armatimonadota bacterium]